MPPRTAGRRAGRVGTAPRAAPRRRRSRLGARVARPPTAEVSTWQADAGVALDEGRQAGGVGARAGVLTLLALVLAAALAGLLGVHTSTATAQRNGYRLTLR